MDDSQRGIHELDGRSPEFRTELAKQLENLVPEAVADGKVDVAKLKELLDEDAGDTSERFGLFWPGKKRAMRAAQDSTTATLKPAPELSKDWDNTENIFIEGDNLEVLKVLQRQYHNKVKMIYIDPPYNTGKDFVYPDNFKEGLRNYLEFSKQVDEGNKKVSTNVDTAGRYHSNWLNMMYPRLKLARNLLTDDGAMFISVGKEELSNLRLIVSEIFGENNIVAVLSREQKSGSNQGEYIAPQLDYVVVVARSRQSLKEFILENKDLEKEIEKSLYQSSLDPMRGCSNQRYWIECPDGSYIIPPGDNYPTEIKDGNNLSPKSRKDKVWRWSYASYLANKEQLRFKQTNRGSLVNEKLEPATWNIYTVKNNIDSEMRPRDYIFGFTNSVGTAELQTLKLDGMFDNPKPTELVEYLMSIMQDDRKSLILDFFSGSSTTAHAVMQLNAEDGGNRRHIQVQLPEPTDEKSEAYKAGYRKISDIARERISRAGEKIKTDFAEKLAERDKPLDVGYRTYKLADTNFTKWQSAATADLGEVQARLDLMRESSNDEATEADLLTEVMLKIGLPLATKITTRDIDGLTVYQIAYHDDDEAADVQPVFYMNEHVKPTLEQLRAIVTELTPTKLVILEDAFQGDNELKTNLVQTCKSYDVELWTV